MLAFRQLFCVLSFGLLALGAAPQFAVQEPAKKQEPPRVENERRPHVEVVFCLDTTGSMGGLIEAAKQKIWAISNQISSGKPTPHVKIGLVAFRDRGDAYITKVVDLSDDLDAIHGHLMSFKAEGGGDTPESVNQALHESVTKISWSKDKKTLRMIFLVGDAPPHMDYPDDVKYPETCKLALKNDIIINTVQCGNDATTKKYWLDICRSAEGSYVQIDAQGGPIVAVATPFDADLAKINVEINKSQLVFGNVEKQIVFQTQLKASAKISVTSQADRAAFNARNHSATAYDLIRNINEGKVKLEEIKKEDLPPELKGKTLVEQKEVLQKIEQQRNELSKKAIDLDKKRTEYINKKLAADQKNLARDGFDSQVLQILQRQAGRANIQYGIDEKKK